MAYEGASQDHIRKSIQKVVSAKIADARTLRNDRAALINETYRLAAPWRRRVGQAQTKAPILNDSDLADMVDSTLAETISDFASDMIQRFTPESEPWVRMKAKGSIPAEFQLDVDRMAMRAEELVFETLEESSYFDAAPQCFKELGNGTMAMRARRPQRGGDPYEFEAIEPCDLLLCQSPSRGISDARFTEGKMKVVDYKALYGRQAPLPTTQHWGDDQEITVIDGFYRCWEHPRGDRAWRRVILVNEKIVWEAFIGDDPDVDMIVSRWEVDGQSPWGIGATFRAHAAQRGLSELTAIMMVAAGKHVDTPGFFTEDGVANLEQGFEAGDMIPVSADFDVKWWEPGGQLNIAFFTENDMREMIRHALFQDKPEQKGKTPPTAEQWSSLETRTLQRWEIPRGKIVREWVVPIVMWTKRSLELEGRLGPYKVDNRFFQIVPNSPFAKARQEREVMVAGEILSVAAELSPDTFGIDVDMPATIQNIKKARNDKLVVIRSPEERAKMMAAMAAAQGGGGGAA